MIISHKHQFIFIKTEKTAGTSLEIALSAICGPKDIITPITEEDEKTREELGYAGFQNHHVPFRKYSMRDMFHALRTRQRLSFYNHISSSEIKGFIDKDVWNRYFKFCVERNPWDKLISWYYWKGGETKYGSILKFMQCGDAAKIRGIGLYTEGGKPTVDKICRYETINEDLDKVSKIIGLDEPIKLSNYKAKANTRKNKLHYRDVLTNEEAALASEIFSKEISLLGYKY